MYISTYVDMCIYIYVSVYSCFCMYIFIYMYIQFCWPTSGFFGFACLVEGCEFELSHTSQGCLEGQRVLETWNMRADGFLHPHRLLRSRYWLFLLFCLEGAARDQKRLLFVKD